MALSWNARLLALWSLGHLTARITSASRIIPPLALVLPPLAALEHHLAHEARVRMPEERGADEDPPR